MSSSIGFETHIWAENNLLASTFFEETTSTNTIAKNLTISDFLKTPFRLILADSQSQGRGRQTNTWTNPPTGTSLLSSWCFYLPEFPQPILTCKIGLSLYQALKQTWPQVSFALKAPNDIYIQNQKVAGILIESISQGSHTVLIIGIGLNVLNHPESLQQSTSIGQHSSVSKNQWTDFLDLFFKLLKQNLEQASEKILNTATKQELLIALNQWTLLNSPYLEVLDNGSLRNAEKVISWQEL